LPFFLLLNLVKLRLPGQGRANHRGLRLRDVGYSMSDEKPQYCESYLFICKASGIQYPISALNPNKFLDRPKNDMEYG